MPKDAKLDEMVRVLPSDDYEAIALKRDDVISHFDRAIIHMRNLGVDAIQDMGIVKINYNYVDGTLFGSRFLRVTQSLVVADYVEVR